MFHIKDLETNEFEALSYRLMVALPTMYFICPLLKEMFEFITSRKENSYYTRKIQKGELTIIQGRSKSKLSCRVNTLQLLIMTL